MKFVFGTGMIPTASALFDLAKAVTTSSAVFLYSGTFPCLFPYFLKDKANKFNML